MMDVVIAFPDVGAKAIYTPTQTQFVIASRVKSDGIKYLKAYSGERYEFTSCVSGKVDFPILPTDRELKANSRRIPLVKEEEPRKKDLLPRVNEALLASSGVLNSKGGDLMVASWVLEWGVQALVFNKRNKEQLYSYIYAGLATTEEKYQWNWLRDRLPDAALEALIRKLDNSTQQSFDFAA